MTTTDMQTSGFLAPCLTGVHVKARVIKLGRLMCPVAVELVRHLVGQARGLRGAGEVHVVGEDAEAVTRVVPARVRQD